MSVERSMITRTPRTTLANVKRMVLASVALVFAASCQNDSKGLFGPKLQGLAHVPVFSTVQSTSGATFTTDKDDYSPGETLNLSGSGWQANDVLDVHLDETPQNHAPVDWTISVDDSGGFTDATYIVQQSDLGVTFTITATSRATGDVAQATFTDEQPTPSATAVDWTGHGTTNGTCDNIGSSDDLDPQPGQQGWLFILTDPYDNTGSNLTTSFSPSTQSPSNPIPGTFVANDQNNNGQATYHYAVYTSIGATLTSASATNGTLLTFSPSGRTEVHSNLNVSHCESGSGGGEAGRPSIEKTADGKYKNTFKWDITKDVDKTFVRQLSGSVTFNYTVTVTHDAGKISDIAVTGNITVSNPNSGNITGAEVTDVLSDATSCTVTGGSGAVLVPGNNTFPYTCNLTGTVVPSGLSNTAKVTWPDQTLSTSEHLAAGSEDAIPVSIAFTETTIDGSVTVTDLYNSTTYTLGTVTSTDASPQTFTYPRVIQVVPSTCVIRGNTATFTTNTTGTTGSASQSVTVCGGVAGGLTMGFWQNKNGQAIIGSYSGTNCQSLRIWLNTYNPYADLTATTCTAVKTYVTNVIKSATASGTAMNAMLKGQMLATALDVYFSTPTLGGNRINAPTPLGGVKVDLTYICKMIDGSGGTSTCSGIYQNVSFAFGGATSMTISDMLVYAASQSNSGGSYWYLQVKATQELAKNAFDAINNQVAFAAP